MLFQTPVPSSFAREQLQLAYGPGLLLHEADNTVISPTRELQPAERYVYEVSAAAAVTDRAPTQYVHLAIESDRAVLHPGVGEWPSATASCR